MIISTLPAVTVSDLALLSIIPPFRVTISGERIWQSIESALQSCYPQYRGQFDSSGNFRFLDTTSSTDFPHNTVTLGGSDPRWQMPSLHRDSSDCYSQLIVRGDMEVTGVTLALKQWPGSTFTTPWAPSGGTTPTGGLVEDFAGWGGYTLNSAAKAAWVPGDYQTLSLQTGQDQGSCTCGSTTSVTITSSNTSADIRGQCARPNGYGVACAAHGFLGHHDERATEFHG